MTGRTLDLLDPDTHAGNPWELYDWLREEAPLYFDEGNRLWCVSRYDDVVRVARDPDTFTSNQGNRPGLPYDGSFIHLEGKGHTERRNLVADRFGAKGVARLEQHIRTVTRELFDAVQGQGRCDFVESVSAPLPMRIIADMCGVPEEHHDVVRTCLDAACKGGSGPKHVTDEVNFAFMTWAEIHFQLAMERRNAPRDDLLSMWVQADIEHAPFDEESLLFEHTMMLVGGSETTRNVVNGGLYELLQRPEDLAFLRAHPEALPNAVEEMIRWVTPFVSMSRTVTRDVVWGDVTMREGDEIMMLYPAANRDPRRFPDPYRFDIRRSFATPSLSFGYGRHFCLGARLARAELRILFDELLRRWDAVSLDGEPTWARSSFIRGITAMPVHFDDRTATALASK